MSLYVAPKKPVSLSCWLLWHLSATSTAHNILFESLCSRSQHGGSLLISFKNIAVPPCLPIKLSLSLCAMPTTWLLLKLLRFCLLSLIFYYHSSQALLPYLSLSSNGFISVASLFNFSLLPINLCLISCWTFGHFAVFLFPLVIQRLG